jgi:biopolymer transport protein ExbB
MRALQRFSAIHLVQRICCGVSFCLMTFGWTQSIEQLTERQQNRLEEATERLKVLRLEIRDQQIPMGKKLSDLRYESDSKERLLKERQRLRDRSSLSLEQLESQVAAGKKELDYIAGNLFNEFESSFKTALSPGEITTFGEDLRQLDLLLERDDTTEAEKISASMEQIADSLDRIDGLLAGKRYPGSALDPEGKQLAGSFIQVGPLLYFISESKGTVGWVEETRTLKPKMRSIGSSEVKAIQNLSETGIGLLPVDPTLGDAVAFAETKESWQEHFKKGGVWVIPIIGFAILSMVVAIYKSIQVSLIRQPQSRVVHEIIEKLGANDSKGALSLAASQSGPAAQMLTEGVKNAGESVELVEEVMFESILGAQPKLERFLNVIAVTAATAPLLGLLGTVTGIIKTFKLMEIFGAGDPKPLISGISEALITTEMGLVLAIPALIAHALLSRRVAGILAQMEKLSIAFVNGLSRRDVGFKAAENSTE